MDWRADLYNRLKNKMEFEVSKWGISKSYTGNITVEELSIFFPSEQILSIK